MFVINVDWFFLSHRLPIALEAKRLGYEVHVATGLTDKLNELERHGLIVHPLTLNRSSTGLIGILRLMVELWKIFRAVRPDLVHLVTIKPVLLGGLIARLTKIPAVVVAISGLGFVYTANGFNAILRRWLVGTLYRVALNRRNLKVIFQNLDDRASLAKTVYLPDSKIELIRGSGVDLTQYQQLPLLPGTPVIILAARLLVDKGVREFVEAAKILQQRGVQARFCLVGAIDPDNPNSLTDADLAKWVQDGVIELWGQRSDMPQVITSAQIVVLPSYREGLPKILVEAAACGRAVITTDCPGCRDSIIPCVTGLLVPVRDTMALADVLEELILDPTRCQAMGSAGRILAENSFDVRHVTAAHMRIYETLISKRLNLV